jgi:hypothetical protein
VYEDSITWEQLQAEEADTNGLQLHIHGIIQFIFPDLESAMAAFDEREQPV